MVKICSWDIGIINLSYCILEKVDENIKIIKWDKINILEDENEDYKPKCGGYKKNNIKCEHLATVCGMNNNEKLYYCELHKNQFKIDNLNIEIIKSTDKCQYEAPITKKVCDKIVNCQIEGRLYCTSHKKIMMNKINKDNSLKKINIKKSTSHDPQILCVKLFRKLEGIPEILDVDEVLVENQLAYKNPKMKTISAFVYSYFTLRGIIDKNITNSTIKTIKFKSAENKLKINNDKTIEIFKKTDKKRHPKLTKELAIEYTKILLKDDQTWLDHLNSYKKKDDLSDALLQGYHYLITN